MKNKKSVKNMYVLKVEAMGHEGVRRDWIMSTGQKRKSKKKSWATWLIQGCYRNIAEQCRWIWVGCIFFTAVIYNMPNLQFFNPICQRDCNSIYRVRDKASSFWNPNHRRQSHSLKITCLQRLSLIIRPSAVFQILHSAHHVDDVRTWAVQRNDVRKW